MMSDTISVKITQLDHAMGLALPAYQTSGSAGLDLMAAIRTDEELILRPLKRALVPTGLSIALPLGFEAQVRPRSGLALKHGITCLNSPGTIDSDYRGELKIILINLGEDDFTIRRGDRIAQLVLARTETLTWNVVETLDDTERGDGGFGSTSMGPR
jgi:dUTP pyrophosphatase